jgi:hypothetical protein
LAKYLPSIFYKFSAGILEYMFNGYGSEVLYKPFDKNYAVGIEAWKVYQRDYDQMFGTRDYQTTTGHISFTTMSLILMFCLK